MAGELARARSHPAVVVSIVVAAVAVTACALVAIAYMLGWIPRATAPSPMSVALPGSQVAGSMPDVALLPGESVVSAPEAYTPPAARSGSPAPSYGAPQAVPAVPAPSPAPAPAARAAPKKPAFARSDPPPPAARSFCINCGTVAAIGNYTGGWEVRVRFEDGSSDTLRYAERPRVRVGDKVYVENGRLIPE